MDRRPEKALDRAQEPGALAQLARPWLFWMQARLGFTASLAVLGDELVYVAWLPSRLAGQAERAAVRQPGWSAAAHTRAAGLALLAYMAESDWPAGTPLHADIDGRRDEIFVQGYARSEGAGEVGVAAAVLGASEPIAAVELTVFGEQARSVATSALMAGVVISAADGIAEHLAKEGWELA